MSEVVSAACVIRSIICQPHRVPYDSSYEILVQCSHDTDKLTFTACAKQIATEPLIPPAAENYSHVCHSTFIVNSVMCVILVHLMNAENGKHTSADSGHIKLIKSCN